MTARITAVIPCFNPGSLIIEAVESLQAQTLPPAEIIVVDDCSTDPPTERAITQLSSLATVRIIRQPRNAGPGAARNAGVDATSAPLIMFLDADDTLAPGSLATLSDALATTSRAGFAYVSIQSFGNTRARQEAPPFNPYTLHLVNYCSSAALFRREVFDAGLRFSEDRTLVTEDWDMFLSATAAGFPGVAAPGATLRYRRYGFSRIDGSDVVDEHTGNLGLDQRRRRPDIFAPDRLLQLKAAHAPAVSLALPAHEVALALTDGTLGEQTLPDHELLHVDGSMPTGKVLCALSTSGVMRRDRWLLERIVAPFEARLHPPMVLVLRAQALRTGVGGTGGGIEAGDVVTGGIAPGDIVGVAIPQALLEGAAYELDGNRTEAIFALASEMWSEHARAVRIIAGPDVGLRQVSTSEAALWTRVRMADRASVALGHPASAGEDLERKVRLASPAALSWRTTGRAEGLFPQHRQVSRLRVLRLVRDVRFPSHFLVGEDQEAWTGCEIIDEAACRVHEVEAWGTSPMLRVIDPATEERAVVVGAPSQGWSVEAVLGYAEIQAVPGAIPLGALVEGSGATSAAWVYPCDSPTESGEVGRGVVVNGSAIWRGARNSDGRHVYGFPASLTRRGIDLEGPIFELLSRPPVGIPTVPIQAVSRPGQVEAAGLVREGWSGRLPTPLQAEGAVGFLPAERTHPHQRQITVAVRYSDQDLLVSNIPGEGALMGYREIGVLGYAQA